MEDLLFYIQQEEGLFKKRRATWRELMALVNSNNKEGLITKLKKTLIENKKDTIAVAMARDLV